MPNTFWETVQVTGGQAVDKVKELIAEGNVRRVRIKHKDRVVAEFPLSIGVVGAVFAPILAAIATISALLTECTIDVERDVVDGGPAAPTSPPANPPTN